MGLLGLAGVKLRDCEYRKSYCLLSILRTSFLSYQMESYVTRQAVDQGVGDNPDADQLQSDHVNPAL